MRPDNWTTAGRVRRIKQMRSADFPAAGGCQFYDDQIAFIVREQEPVNDNEPANILAA